MDMLLNSIRDVGSAAMALALTNAIPDENAVKEFLQQEEYLCAVTEVGGNTSQETFQERTTKAVIGAALNNKIVGKEAYQIHDLYGCQEFGWITMDGCPVRNDIELVPLTKGKGQALCELVVGGLPTGDSFPVSESGHICNPTGKIITYRRERTYPEFEVVLQETTLSSAVTAARLARSILRVKGRIVKVSPNLVTNAAHTVLELVPDTVQRQTKQTVIIRDAAKTKLFDDLVQAQLDYQQNSKADPVWQKRK